VNQRTCEEIIGRMGLTAYDFGDTIVQVNHEDGTALTFRHALAWRHGDYLLVASEHNGYHYFHTGDLAFWGLYRGQGVPFVDHEGTVIIPATCDYCCGKVPCKDLRLAPIPTEQIDLCPSCYNDYERGLIDPTKNVEEEEDEEDVDDGHYGIGLGTGGWVPET
jgi:hypothetical protein